MNEQKIAQALQQINQAQFIGEGINRVILAAQKELALLSQTVLQLQEEIKVLSAPDEPQAGVQTSTEVPEAASLGESKTN